MTWDLFKEIIFLLTFVGGVATFAIAIQSYLHTHRPYLGISNVDTLIDTGNATIEFKITQKNYGVLPAAGVKSNSKVYKNDELISERTGDDEIIIFPKQESHGSTKLHSVDQITLPNDKFIIEYQLFYRIPFLWFYDRKFSTTYKMQYNHITGRPAFIDGSIV